MMYFIEYYLSQFLYFCNDPFQAIGEIFNYYIDSYSFGATPQDIVEISHILTSLHFFSYCVIIFLIIFFIVKFIIKKVGELL